MTQSNDRMLERLISEGIGPSWVHPSDPEELDRLLEIMEERPLTETEEQALYEALDGEAPPTEEQEEFLEELSRRIDRIEAGTIESCDTSESEFDKSELPIVQDLLASGPPPVGTGEKSLAAKIGAKLSFSFLTVYDVAGVKCEVYEREEKVFFVPPTGRKPRNLTIGGHSCKLHEPVISGCFEIEGLTPDDVVRIVNDTNKNAQTQAYHADWD